MVKAQDFVGKLLDVARNYKTVYMWGVFGAPVTESVIDSKARQYPSWYTSARQNKFRKLAGKGYFGFDCVCLIKGLLWGWNGDASKTYGGAKYASNGVPDISADSMIAACGGVSSDFSWVEVGEALWCEGHIGVYVGDGLAVECTPKWNGDVQITAVANIGRKAGYNSRKWKKHGKLPYISYEAKPPDAEIRVGGKVRIRSGAKTYDGKKLASFVYKREHTVSQLSGDRAVVTFGGVVIAAVRVGDLTPV